MPGPFLQVFPREIRDQIYTYILSASDGTVGLLPWNHTVATSLTIMRTCKQIHREVKDIIWAAHALNLRDHARIQSRFRDYARRDLQQLHHIQIDLEVMDRDELEWIMQGLQSIQDSHMKYTVKSITLRTIWERPRSIKEYKEVMLLRKDGHVCDGRLIREQFSQNNLLVHTGWPRFSHWGKQKWLKEMLLDTSGGLLKEIHGIFGGDMFVDGFLMFRDGIQSVSHQFNPRDSVVKIVPEATAFKRRPYERSTKARPSRHSLAKRPLPPINQFG